LPYNSFVNQFKGKMVPHLCVVWPSAWNPRSYRQCRLSLGSSYYPWIS